MMRRIKLFIEKREKEWEDGKKLSSVLKTIMAVVCIGLAIVGWSWVFAHLVNYVIVNIDWIMFTVVVGIIIICAVKVWFPSEKYTLPPTTESTMSRDEISHSLKTNYELLCTALFNILPNIHGYMKVILPNYEAELYSEKRIIRQGHAVLYEYILYKSGSIATESIKRTLSQQFEMDLKNGRIIGISNTHHVYDGVAVSIIQVHSVIDGGAFYRVRLAIANDDYCKQMRHTLSVELAQKATALTSHNDSDF